jgi:RND family efflux transporter MFP subunit
MHPQVIQNHAGNCPICGMKLIPIRKKPGAGAVVTNFATGATGAGRRVKYYKSSMNAGEVSQNPGKDTMGMEMVAVYEDESAADSGSIVIDPATVQNMDIRTAVVARGPLRRTIRTVGVVDYNETTLRDVSVKFRGWIEKLYADSTGKQLHRGDPLFEIYSPDLYSAQTEYALALGQNSSGDATKTSALNKLKFYDVPAGQIAEIEKTREARKTIRIDAPRDGVVVEKMAVEGQYVEAGMKLYRLADLGMVWVQADVYEQDLVYLALGQEATVTLSYMSDREFRGRVTYIYPNVDEKTRTARVRMEFHNPGYFLKPGMFVTVKIVSELEPSALLVPDMAILRSGEQTTVFVALEGGKFDPRVVTLGPQAENDQYQVLRGLSEGEKIVTSGQFMLDSESQLREAIQKMTGPKAASESGAPQTARAPDATNAPAFAPVEVMRYICPMPEHVSIQYDHPGKCPICGMTLVPVSQTTLKRLHPGGRILYYTCPMPEHSDVRSDTPGKCPKCGMTLIPISEAPPLPPETVAPTGQASNSKVMTMPDGSVMPAGKE